MRATPPQQVGGASSDPRVNGNSDPGEYWMWIGSILRVKLIRGTKTRGGKIKECVRIYKSIRQVMEWDKQGYGTLIKMKWSSSILRTPAVAFLAPAGSLALGVVVKAY
jgi:hypothetical protein